MQQTVTKKYESIQIDVVRIINEIFEQQDIPNTKEYEQLRANLINSTNSFFHKQRDKESPARYYSCLDLRMKPANR